MQEIAAEAGVNQALLHYYFRSKDRLAEAVFRRAASRLLPAVIEVLASDLALDAKVERIVALEIDNLLAGAVPARLHHQRAAPSSRARAAARAGADRHVARAHRAARSSARSSAQIDQRVAAGTMHPIEPEQFVVNLMSLCIFPFAARPMLMALFGIDQKGFERFIERRRTSLAPFFLKALRP